MMPAYLIQRLRRRKSRVVIVRTQRIFAPRADEALNLAGIERAEEEITDVCREEDENLAPASCGRRKTTVPSKAI